MQQAISFYCWCRRLLKYCRETKQLQSHEGTVQQFFQEGLKQRKRSHGRLCGLHFPDQTTPAPELKSWTPLNCDSLLLGKSSALWGSYKIIVHSNICKVYCTHPMQSTAYTIIKQTNKKSLPQSEESRK